MLEDYKYVSLVHNGSSKNKHVSPSQYPCAINVSYMQQYITTMIFCLHFMKQMRSPCVSISSSNLTICMMLHALHLLSCMSHFSCNHSITTTSSHICKFDIMLLLMSSILNIVLEDTIFHVFLALIPLVGANSHD